MNKRPFRTTRDIVNLRQGRNDWYRITNATATAPARIDIFDEIGWFGVTAADFVKDVAGVTGDLEVHMNCPGGDVFEGVAIYNALKQHKAAVAVHVDGLAASAASFIAQAARPGQLVIAKTASMMIHDAFGMGIGNAADMRQLADLLDQQSDNIAGIYADRSGKPVADWREAMRAESWYVGQQAVDAGLADEVQGGPAAENTWDLSVFARRPGQPALNASADESAWDASKAWANGAASDDPAAFYNGICAGKKDGDPATRAAHALPHHYHPGDAPNRHGVSAALGRVGSTDGLTNEAAARSHLEAHQSAMGSGTDNSADLSWLDQAGILEAFKEATK